MSINVFRKELRLNRRAFLIWAGVLILIVAVYLPFFPYMQSPGYAELLEGFPDAFMEAFNMRNIIFEDINYYYAGLVMQYLLLLAAIYAAMLAGRLVSRDADLNTADFLYTRPVTRTSIMAAKIAAFLLISILLWLIIYAVAAVAGLAVDPGFNLSRQFFVHLSGFLAVLATGGLAFAAAPFINQVSGATSLGVGLGFGFFILDALSKMTGKLAFLKYFNTYYYAGFEEAAGGEPFPGGLLVLLSVFVVGTALGFWFLNRKEFTA